MGKLYDTLTPDLKTFIEAQKLFFVGTSPLSAEGHVNISPKGMDSLRIIDNQTLAYLDVSGSGARDYYDNYAENLGAEGMRKGQLAKNMHGIDGLPGSAKPSF